jgi:branched-chain amino acid transport system permease protein
VVKSKLKEKTEKLKAKGRMSKNDMAKLKDGMEHMEAAAEYKGVPKMAKTLLGKAIRAVSMSEETSRLMGINLNRVISATFFIGGITTGAAAFLYETVYENTKYNVGFNIGLAAFTAAVLGGIGNIRGAFFGGITLGLLEVFIAAVLGTQWKSVTVFVVLVLVLLFRPNGLFGEAITQSRV